MIVHHCFSLSVCVHVWVCVFVGGWFLVRWAYNPNILESASQADLAGFLAQGTSGIVRYTGRTEACVRGRKAWAQGLYAESMRAGLTKV